MDTYPPRRSRSPRSKEDGGHGRDEKQGRDNMDAYRRRSPVDRRRNGRGRSRSPTQIDRYQPGRRDEPPPYRREDSYRRRTPPPNNQGGIDRYVPGQDAAPPLTNPMIDPLKMDTSVGFNYFAEWWRVDKQIREERERQKTGSRRPPERLRGERESREERDKERDLIQDAYDAYKEKLQLQNARIFCQLHKHEEWFKEKYDPEVRDPLRKRVADYRRGTYAQWESDLQAGVFDEFTLEGIYKNESNGAGGVVEKEEGETVAAAEVLGVGDLLPTNGGDLVDEATLQSAVLLKTLAPHVSRVQLEAFCTERLGTGEGGFKWLSLSDPNTTKKCHRIGWVMLNPGGDETMPAEAEADGQVDDNEDRMDTKAQTTVRTALDKALAAINGESIPDEERGPFVVHAGLHSPNAQYRKKALWDLFSAPERIERDLELAIRLVGKFEQEMGDDITGLNKIEERVEEIRSNGLLQSASSAKPPRILGEEVDEDEGEMDEGVDMDEEADDEELLTKKKKLDLLVEYLRRVYNFCFFCVFESDSVHELTRKCPTGHLRRPRASLTTAAKEVARASALGDPFPIKKSGATGEQDKENGSPVAEKKFQGTGKTQLQLQRAYNWVKTYEDKLFQLLEPDSVDLKKLGGRPIEEAMDEELKKFVKQEDDSKFRCKVPNCTKLFKGEPFWKKHVEKRHEEWYGNFQKDLDVINNYVLDPGHITPARDGSPGNHMNSNGMQNGTPRGFSLQNMQFGYPGMPPIPPPGFMPNFGQYPMMPMAPYGGFPMDPSGGAGGPMRRGGPGRNNNRAAGPYDRQPRDARNMRWGANGAPGRGGGPGRPGGPPRFADNVGVGPSAISTREAVQGRSLKSYEDLDAVGGEAPGTTEAAPLDY